jgi:CHAT domain-containing protein
MIGYHLDWDSGAYAEIDVFRPEPALGASTDTRFQIRYTPPFRGTYRPRVRNTGLRLQDVEAIVGDSLRSLTEILNEGGDLRGGASASVENPQQAIDELLQMMKTLGKQLLSILGKRKDITTDLRKRLFLSIGMDEALLSYPWELMHDGQDFYCLRHSIGRVVNSVEEEPPPMEDTDWWGNRLENFRVLLIDVARTEKKPGYNYDPLPQAEIEGDTIENFLLDERLGIKCERLSNEKATYRKVMDALYKSDSYKIIHFCGHASVDDKDPESSSLVLFDKPMETRVIATGVKETRPILCFVNACETAPSMADQPKRYRVYDIGRAFLQTGAYLLGTRWKIEDNSASAFARTFYSALLGDGKPIGEAVLEGRLACKREVPMDLGWGAYVLYGDPRVRFKREGLEEKNA